jgi:hypothetical protein
MSWWAWILIGGVVGVLAALGALVRWLVRDMKPFGYWDN